jgi:ribosomal protein L34
MMPNSMKVLRRIGVEERLRHASFQPFSHLNRVRDTGFRHRDGGRMNRRDVIAGLAVAATVGSAWAQEAGRIYRLGVVVQAPRERYDALFDELGRNGFVPGKNLLVDAHGFSTPVADLDATARAVVKAGPDAIYCGGEEACRAVQRVTRAIPIANADR